MNHWSIGKSSTLTDLATCLNRYRLGTVGLYACLRAAVKMKDNFILLDMILMVNAGSRKQCEPDFVNNCFVGPPNFVLDIAEDTETAKFRKRKELLARMGVQEYLLVNEGLTSVVWNRLVEDRFIVIDPDENGLIKSSSLPGLWIPVEALQRRDFWAVMATIDQGMTRREHHELMQTIWKK